jgi:hypothetical protein
LTHDDPPAWLLVKSLGVSKKRSAQKNTHKTPILIECDPAPPVCAKLLTIEIFLTRNLGLRQTALRSWRDRIAAFGC